ncbi:MAG TPA: hypothetical protein VE860_00940 [Chthoniobacterales bacterium]|jgi:hypothetical protein|nr:hypothetical protein [Chthoniobacterales bacterium]
MTAISNVTRSGSDELKLNDAPPMAPVGIVDSFEAREWLLIESERNTRL